MERRPIEGSGAVDHESWPVSSSTFSSSESLSRSARRRVLVSSSTCRLHFVVGSAGKPVNDWSAFDNFEWSEGYRPKFGLIAVDRDGAFTRHPKPSAHAFARVARTGRIASISDAGVTGSR